MRYSIKMGMSLLFAMAVVAAPAMARDHDRDNERDHNRYSASYSDHGRDDRGRDNRRYDNGYARYQDNGRNQRYDRYQDNGRSYSYSGDRYRGNDRAYHRPAPPRAYGNGYGSAYRPAYHGGGYYAPRWSRGVRYYDRGYGPTYAVSNYYGYGLRAPPRGYYWRRSDAGDFLLVALTTGIITDLILHH